MKKNGEHLFVTEMEGGEQKLNFVIDEKSLLLDFKALIKEYYAATFAENENSLILKFNNGQIFALTIKEIK